MPKMKEYQLNVDPRILELLGPNLYTNIYYVLAELVANAYDADAHYSRRKYNICIYPRPRNCYRNEESTIQVE